MSHKSALIQQFTERGYIHQTTNLEGLDDIANQQIVPAYIGFDCTADSLHVGSLAQIMMLRILQKNRAQADCSYGWWHNQGGRPVW